MTGLEGLEPEPAEMVAGDVRARRQVRAQMSVSQQSETSRVQSPPPWQPPACSRRALNQGNGFPGWEWQCFHGITAGLMDSCSTPSPLSHPVASAANCAHNQLSNSTTPLLGIPPCSPTPLPLAACSPRAICWTSSDQSLGERQQNFPLC